MLEKLKAKLSSAFINIKNALPKIDLSNIELPKNTADVEWKDGQPVFKEKKDKKDKK